MAPLLVSPPLMDIRNNNKRSHSDIVCTMSMPTMRMGMFTSMGTSKSNNNKLLRNVSWDIQLSKTSESATKKQKHDHHNHDDDEKKDDDDNSAKDGSMMKNQDAIWYSKEEYKQILIEQSLTVRIMRSLRAILASTNTSASAETPTNLPNDENTNSNVNADNISNNNNALIKKANLLIDPERYCERGLEAYQSKERRNTINTNRKLHMSLVIGEQSRQRRQQQHQSSTMMMMTSNNNGCGGGNSNTNWKCNDDDPELIRNISMIQSKHSSLKAQLLAAIDQQEQVVQESNKPTGTGILQKIQEHNHHDDNNKVIPHPVLSGSSIININERRNLYNQGVAAIANNNKSDNGYYFCVAPTPTPTPCITTSLDTAAVFDTKIKKRPRSSSGDNNVMSDCVTSLLDKSGPPNMTISQHHQDQHQNQQYTTDSFLKPAQYPHHHLQHNTTNRVPTTTALADAFQLEQQLLHHRQASQQQQQRHQLQLHQQLLLFQHQQQQQQRLLALTGSIRP